MAVTCAWLRAEWAIRLVSLLTGRAGEAHVTMDINSVDDYEQVKQAILATYEINTDMNRQRFRDERVRARETPHELYVHFRDMARWWIPPEEHTVDTVIDVVLIEQFLHMLATEIRVWVWERDPKSASENVPCHFASSFTDQVTGRGLNRQEEWQSPAECNDLPEQNPDTFPVSPTNLLNILLHIALMLKNI
uniref:SCAN box domain-containing protein n=1 Tax=Salarias fasciatus TaxID=181472 RepID=A0A672IMJ7_SALFA